MTPVLVGSRPFTRLVLAAGALFVLLVLLELHGFSLPFWHQFVDNSPATEVLAGQARQHRWDDYAVQLPFALGQSAHEPAFPVVNENIGLGQNMLVPTPLPVAHLATLFRPTLWGFFLGEDRGLAWMWWSQILGVLVVWTAVFHGLLRAPLGLAAGACGLILFSPFFQFWSFNMAAATTYVGLCALGLSGLACAQRIGAILASGLLLGWAGGCFLLTLYPPYLVSLAALLVTLMAGLLLERRSQPGATARKGWRVVGLVVALGCTSIAVAALLSGAADAIEIIRRTEYPGTRISTGGERPLWWLMSTNLAATLQVSGEGWKALGNICEAASCWLVSPAIAALVLWRWLRGAGRPDALTLGLLIYCTLGIVYCHFGVGELLARVTLLSHVPAKRAVLGLTLAEAMLVVRFVTSSEKPVGPGSRSLRVGHAFLALAWMLAVGASALRLRTVLPELRFTWMAGAAAVQGLAVYALAERWHPHAVVAGVGAALCACSAWFNPLVRGGADYLRENPLARHVVEIDRASGGQSVWAVYGHSAMASLIVANGVRVLDGEQPIPQLALWKRLDPRLQHLHEYNRYANVKMKWPSPTRQSPAIRLFGEADLTLYIDPNGDELRKLGATHILVMRQGALAEFFAPYRPLAEVGPYGLFSLPLQASTAR